MTKSDEQVMAEVTSTKKSWLSTIVSGLKVAGKWVLTPKGFLITIYMLNVIAWGGMLFLLLCGAAPAMCHPDCNDINSARRKWIEIDSQVVNSLFCLPAFGLIPYRFRDLYLLLVWRLGIRGANRRMIALRKLAGIHSDWFRLPGSDTATSTGTMDEENPAIPLPTKRKPPTPISGVKAPPTALWKMDLVVWLFVWNTFFQAILSGFMWGYNRFVSFMESIVKLTNNLVRFNRPPWAVGLFLCLGFIAAGSAGIIMALESRKIKKIESGSSSKEQAQASPII
jgi:hypothetical protein